MGRSLHTFFGIRLRLTCRRQLRTTDPASTAISGYRVFQAHDGLDARELCYELPKIGLLILNSTGAGVDTPSLIGLIRSEHPDLAVLHIGPSRLPGMPSNVPTLPESFTVDQLLMIVESLMTEPEIANVQAE